MALLPPALPSQHLNCLPASSSVQSGLGGSRESKDCCHAQVAVWLFFPRSLHTPLSMAGLEVRDSWPARSDSSFPGVFLE